MRTGSKSNSDKVRDYVKARYVLPARKRGERAFTVTAGDVHRDLGLQNQVPVVCTALRSQRFLAENHLVLKSVAGPPSGLSTTVKFTFEIQSENALLENPLIKLFGVANGLYAGLGGGENFIRKEREAFHLSAESREKAMSGSEDFATVWRAVEANAGADFATANGLPFRYAMAGESVWIEREGRIIDQSLSKEEFRKAFERWPVNGPGEIQDVRGPSHVFAILNDPRILKRAAR